MLQDEWYMVSQLLVYHVAMSVVTNCDSHDGD